MRRALSFGNFQMPRTKTDTETMAAIVAFLATSAADHLSDRAIARKFGVGHPKIARARAARHRDLSAAVEHKTQGQLTLDPVEHKAPRPAPDTPHTENAVSPHAKTAVFASAPGSELPVE